jgi:antitoxin FitA
MVSKWFYKDCCMATNITLKNIPDDVYARLKHAAENHRRSINSEAIVCLEAALMPNRLQPSERLLRIRTLRAGLDAAGFKTTDIDAFKRAGRP